MRKLLSGLFAALSLIACEKTDDGPKQVELTGGTQSNQTLYADETSKGNGISFKAAEAWSATVTEATGKSAGSRVEWLTLDRYEGGAGTFTLQMTLQQNNTGNDRKAEIRITCDQTTITVTVNQKGTTESGDLPVDKSPTYDGKEPYVHFESEEIELSAARELLFTVPLKTNMEAPVIRITPDVESSEVATVTEFVRPNADNEGNTQLILEIFQNREDRIRTAKLEFMTFDEQVIGSVVLKQQAGPICEIVDKQAEVGKLNFKVKANAATKFVAYGVSETAFGSDEEIAEFLNDPNNVKELELNGGTEETFDVTVDNLIPATTYFFYLLSKTEYTEEGIILIDNATTAQQESKHDLVLEVSANPANEFTVYLPFGSEELSGTIDWGDGSTEKLNGWKPQGIFHKYTVTSPTTFTVRYSGVLRTIYPSSDIRSARENTLLAVKQWGYTGLRQIDLGSFSSLREIAPDTEGAFRGMEHFGKEPFGGSFTDTGIEAIPDGFFDYAVNAASFDYTFGGCKKLTTIPDGLFKNCTQATSFQRTFLECELIEQIPENLFATNGNVTTFWGTFAHCTALKSIPANLFAGNPEVVSFEGTFGNCTNLTEIPGDLFANCPKATYFGMSKLRDDSHRGGLGVFENCASLTGVPGALFAGNPAALDLSYAFNGCKLLTELPQNLFSRNTKLEQLEGTFQNCELLEDVPVSIFDNNRKLTNVGTLFSQCRKLKGESPYTLINGNKVHLYERSSYNTEFVAINQYYRCFENCTELSDYDTIEQVW